MVFDLCKVMLDLFRFYFEISKKSESSTEDLWYPNQDLCLSKVWSLSVDKKSIGF